MENIGIGKNFNRTPFAQEIEQELTDGTASH
jgi:hypothetical protein